MHAYIDCISHGGEWAQDHSNQESEVTSVDLCQNRCMAMVVRCIWSASFRRAKSVPWQLSEGIHLELPIATVWFQCRWSSTLPARATTNRRKRHVKVRSLGLWRKWVRSICSSPRWGPFWPLAIWLVGSDSIIICRACCCIWSCNRMWIRCQTWC